ncbi:hypothetical protein WJX72_005100 [[Myrmecia] bisecta]|uniref:RHOMBOID-like protein n=1 Tax=[Myrmecia] bisecta TaxID=41462 RepID=A0AAW1Q7C7_9CHLO
MLGGDGHVKPIPREDDFALPSGTQRAVPDSDLALAIRLQEEEMARLRASQQAPRGPSGSPPRQGRNRRQPTSGHSFSYLNLVFYAISAAYLALFLVSFSKSSWSFENVNINPMVGPSARALRDTGMRVSANIEQEGQYWRLLSSIFLPSGVILLFCILTSIWTFGKYMERVAVCPLLTVPLLFLLSSVTGAVLSTVYAQQYDTVGATAGVCGLLGGVWADQLVNWRSYANHMATLAVLVVMTAAFLLLGLLPFLDNFFNLGGLLVGGLFAAMVIQRKQGGGRRRCHCGHLAVQVVCGCLMVAIITLAALSLAINKGQVGKDCSWCDNVTCVSTRWWTCNPMSGVQGAPNCNVTPFNNGTALVDCPSGASETISVTGTPNTAGVTQICRDVCLARVPTAPSVPGSSGGSGRSPAAGGALSPVTAPIGDGGLI